MTGRFVRTLLVCLALAFPAVAFSQTATPGFWSSSPSGSGALVGDTIHSEGQCAWYFADSATAQPPVLETLAESVHIRFDNDITAAQGAGQSATATIQTCVAKNAATECGDAADPAVVLDGAAGTAGVSFLAARFIRATLSCGSELCSLMVCGQ